MHLCPHLTDEYNKQIGVYHFSKKCSKRHLKGYVQRALVVDQIATADVTGFNNAKNCVKYKNKDCYEQAFEKQYYIRREKMREFEAALKDLQNNDSDRTILEWGLKKLDQDCKNLLKIKSTISNLKKKN